MRRVLVAGVIALAACAGVAAQPYPAKTIEVIAGFPRGSGADITARVVGAKFYEIVGRQFYTENRPGAAGNLAAELVAKSPPDGYTLLVGTVTNAVNAALYPNLPFDFSRDFAPVTLATAEPNLLVVHPSTPAKSVKELVALARSRPGQLNFSSAGAGTPSQLAGDLFRMVTGVSLTQVPARDDALALAALAGGKTDLMFPPVSGARPHVEEGRLRALAVTASSRLASLPALPTMAESGAKGCEAGDWFGFLAPAKTPPAVVARLHGAILQVLGLPDVRNQFELQDIEIIGGAPERFADHIRAETAKWAKVVRFSGARAD